MGVPMESQLPLDAEQPAAGQVFTVTEITRRVRRTLEDTFGTVWVTGEVSNLRRPQSGHLYLTLKDANAQLAAVLWRGTAARLRFELQDGLEVLVRGKLTVYEPRGSYQIIVDQILPKGVGALQLALRQLEEKLRQEGLFDPIHKKPLPMLPRRIGLVTSPSGAAIRDLLNTIYSRMPRVETYLVPVRVQGEGAAAEIARAIADLNRFGGIDVIIIGRGGGSLEDLWAFNEEIVARAIYASDVPVVSAVGHEIDTTIADFVADVRALTPTHAGQLVVPQLDELDQRLEDGRERLRRSLQHRTELARSRLKALAESYALRVPRDLVRQNQQRTDELLQRAGLAVRRRLEAATERFAARGAQLDSLSPLRVLERGYSVTTDKASHRPFRDAAELQPGQEIRTILWHGSVLSRVSEILPDSERSVDGWERKSDPSKS